MLGTFPTWFQIRERGKQYSIAVRVQMLEPEIWGSYDLQESRHLTEIHNLLMDRCNINRMLIREIDPAYDWFTNNGLRYNYYTYPIPFPWRHPFIKWLNELVGPEGVKPTVPHNIPAPNGNAYGWDAWDPPPMPRRAARPVRATPAGTVNVGGQVYTATAATGTGTNTWTIADMQGLYWTGGTAGGTR